VDIPRAILGSIPVRLAMGMPTTTTMEIIMEAIRDVLLRLRPSKTEKPPTSAKRGAKM